MFGFFQSSFIWAQTRNRGRYRLILQNVVSTVQFPFTYIVLCVTASERLIVNMRIAVLDEHLFFHLFKKSNFLKIRIDQFKRNKSTLSTKYKPCSNFLFQWCLCKPWSVEQVSRWIFSPLELSGVMRSPGPRLHSSVLVCRTDPLEFSKTGACLSDHVHRFYGAVSNKTMRPEVR